MEAVRLFGIHVVERHTNRRGRSSDLNRILYKHLLSLYSSWLDISVCVYIPASRRIGAVHGTSVLFFAQADEHQYLPYFHRTPLYGLRKSRIIFRSYHGLLLRTALYI